MQQIQTAGQNCADTTLNSSLVTTIQEVWPKNRKVRQCEADSLKGRRHLPSAISPHHLQKLLNKQRKTRGIKHLQGLWVVTQTATLASELSRPRPEGQDRSLRHHHSISILFFQLTRLAYTPCNKRFWAHLITLLFKGTWTVSSLGLRYAGTSALLAFHERLQSQHLTYWWLFCFRVHGRLLSAISRSRSIFP